MRTLLILLLLILGASEARSQDTLKQYLDYGGKVIKSRADPLQLRPFYYREVVKRDGHYLVYDYFLHTGAMAKTGVYADEELEIEDGIQYEFHENKRLKSKTPYANGKLQGMVAVYDSAGKRIDSAYYVNGMPMGRTVRENDMGYQVGDFDTLGHGVGIERTYYKDGKLMLIGYYKKGYIMDSVWVSYYPNGNVAAKVTYENDSSVNAICYDVDGNIQENCVAEKMPEFNGDLNRFLRGTMHYPEDARQAGIEGRVLVQFIVDRDGTVTVTKVISNTYDALNIEAIRVVKRMPRWLPGKQYNLPVKVEFTLPISFRLH